MSGRDFFEIFTLGLSLNVSKTEFILYGDNKNQVSQWINELKCGKVSNEVRHLGIYINIEPHKTVTSTFVKIKEKMNNYVKFFIHTKVDLFKRKILLEMAIHSQFNHFFQSCHIDKKSLNDLWKHIVNVLWATKFPINKFAGRRLIAIDRLPASYSVGGLKMTPTSEKYKRLSIESNFKVLKNAFFEKEDFISKYINHEIPEFKTLGSKGLIKLSKNLPHTLEFLRETLIFLSNMLLKLENSPTYFSGSSIFNSKYNTLFFKLNSTESNLLKKNNIICFGHLIINREFATELTPSLKPKIDLILDQLEETFSYKKVLSVNHLHLIFSKYLEMKEFRPKIMLKKEFDEKMAQKYSVAPSFNTRMKDKVFVLQDKNLSNYAFKKSIKLPLSSIYKSFNIQILNRTLFTAQKAYNCKVEGEDGNCVKCGEKEDTSHLLIDCDQYSYPLWLELNASVKAISAKTISEINWMNIIFHKNIRGLDNTSMEQLSILMQIIKYGIYVKRKSNIIHSDSRIRAHLILYCNKAIMVHNYIGKTSFFLENLKECFEVRLITKTAIKR